MKLNDKKKNRNGVTVFIVCIKYLAKIFTKNLNRSVRYLNSLI